MESKTKRFFKIRADMWLDVDQIQGWYKDGFGDAVVILGGNTINTLIPFKTFNDLMIKYTVPGVFIEKED
jgi:hypothetical protein